MAIVEMKRMSLLALKRDREKLMKAVQKAGCVQFLETTEQEGEAKDKSDSDALINVKNDLNQVQWAIGRMRKYDTAGKPMFGCLPEVDAADAEKVFSDREELMQIVRRLEELEAQSGELRSEEARINASKESLSAWMHLDLPKNRIASSPNVQVFAGTVQTRKIEELSNALMPLAVSMEECGQSRDLTCVFVMAHKSCAKEAENALLQAGFAAESFSFLQDGETPQDAGKRLDGEMNEIVQTRCDIETETAGFADRIPDLKLLYDQLSVEMTRLENEKHAIETRDAFYAEGWIPAKQTDKLAGKLKKLSPACEIDFRDPEEGEDVPVALANDWLSTPFESVVEGFALPNYHAYDPTRIMAPFYACLFGMMVSDAGYGLIMALIIPLFIKLKKIKFENAKMLWLLTWGGVMTVVWGLIYNTVFGFNPLPVTILDSVNNSLPVMIVCIAVGALHLFTGLGIAAYLNIKKGDWLAALADQIAWMMVLIGLGLLILPSTAQVGTILAIVGAVIILFFTRRDTKNPLKRMISGLGALYGITSWVSDLLSYMRLFGMGLATGVIGMVFNQLIGMIWNGTPILKPLAVVLFIFCHGFNLAINVLGAYVHSCRLQYIEFFGKFYEEGGKPFKPMNGKTKYVSIREDAA